MLAPSAIETVVLGVLLTGGMASGAWGMRQILEHARVMAGLSAEMEAHIKEDDDVHLEVRAIGEKVSDIRVEQGRVAEQLTITNQALGVAVTTAATAATAAALAVQQAADARAVLVAQTAADTAKVLAASTPPVAP